MKCKNIKRKNLSHYYITLRKYSSFVYAYYFFFECFCDHKVIFYCDFCFSLTIYPKFWKSHWIMMYFLIRLYWNLLNKTCIFFFILFNIFTVTNWLATKRFTHILWFWIFPCNGITIKRISAWKWTNILLKI